MDANRKEIARLVVAAEVKTLKMNSLREGRILTLPPVVPEGQNVNSRGRQPTVARENIYDPVGFECFFRHQTVGCHPRLLGFGRVVAKESGAV